MLWSVFANCEFIVVFNYQDLISFRSKYSIGQKNGWVALAFVIMK